MTDLMSVGLPYLGELFLLLSVWYTFLSSFPSSATAHIDLEYLLGRSPEGSAVLCGYVIYV